MCSLQEQINQFKDVLPHKSKSTKSKMALWTPIMALERPVQIHKYPSKLLSSILNN
jgi:hypothetical protein